MTYVMGALLLLVGVSLAASPWWSATLPRSDYPLVLVLGVIFGGGGMFMSIPQDRAPRVRTLAFCLWIGAFGVMCASIALTPFHPDADGTFRIAGVPAFVAAAIPWWARIVAGSFGLLLLGASGAGLWGLLRGSR
jgi:uncharacterized membrane protein HdeD (DUF308 family)